MNERETGYAVVEGMCPYCDNSIVLSIPYLKPGDFEVKKCKCGKYVVVKATYSLHKRDE